MAIEIPKLSYPPSALAPYLSSDSVHIHLALHQDSARSLNSLLESTQTPVGSLEKLVRSSQGRMFELAAEVANQSLYWANLSAPSNQRPPTDLAALISKNYQDLAQFQRAFECAAMTLIQPGWVWLVQRPGGQLGIITTYLNNTPLTGDDRPLLVCDLWEHAYYMDYQHERGRYLQGFWQIVNWEVVAGRLR